MENCIPLPKGLIPNMKPGQEVEVTVKGTVSEQDGEVYLTPNTVNDQPVEMSAMDHPMPGEQMKEPKPEGEEKEGENDFKPSTDDDAGESLESYMKKAKKGGKMIPATQ
jgi:hypothetical protein